MARRRAVVSATFRGRAERRKSEWVASVDATQTSALAAGAAVLDQTLAQLEPVTILRTRGLLFISSDQVASNEEQFGALGMAVVSTPAATAGVASIPTPITEEFSDLWFLYAYFATANSVGGGAGTGVPVTNGMVFPFDSKAQRKVVSDESIVVTLENASAAFGLEYLIKFRMLLMLS